MVLDVYYAPTPNGWKVTILLEELKEQGCGIDYQIIPINLAKGEQHTQEFLKISPNGRMPAIVDGAFTCFESAAIMVYLAEKAGLANHTYLASDLQKRMYQLQWLFWVQGGLGPMGGQLSHFVNYAPHIAPDADHSYSLNRYRAEYDRLLHVMERELGQHRFLGGDTFSIADMCAFPWVIPYKRFGVKLDSESFPNLRSWFDRVKSRPGVSRGVGILKQQVRVGGEHMDESAKKQLFGVKKSKL